MAHRIRGYGYHRSHLRDLTEGDEGGTRRYTCTSPRIMGMVVVAALTLGAILFAAAPRSISRHSPEGVVITAESRAGAPFQGEMIKITCCTRKTADCLACQANQTAEEFCESSKGKGVTGCKDSESMEVYCLAHGKAKGCGGYCHLIEDGYDYLGGDLLVVNTEDAGSCCSECREHPECTSWTWGKPDAGFNANKCYLKVQFQLKRQKHDGYISGLPGKDSETFQVKNRQGICLDAGDEFGMQPCSTKKTTDQQWRYDRKTGMLKTIYGECLGSPEPAVDGGLLHLRPCKKHATTQQEWAYDDESGLLRNVHDFCIAAPNRLEEGSKVELQECDKDDRGQQWSLWNADMLEVPESVEAMRFEATGAPAVEEVSLYCFELVMPYSGEVDLLKFQLKHRMSIFACDESAVYTNQSLDLSGFRPTIIEMDLYCPKGGIYYTRMNTPIFERLWDFIAKEGRYRFHDWTVKVDPDCVFFPHRLRDVVRGLDDEERKAVQTTGVYFNNCRFGLHGPMEVISTKAFEYYRLGWWNCDKPPQEDVFLDKCMLKLGVKKVDRFELLAEKHCPSPGWGTCQADFVAFHPFRNTSSQEMCVTNAVAGEPDTGLKF